jgi:hypothetical protein
MIGRIALAKCLVFIVVGMLCINSQIQISEATGALHAGDWIQYDVASTPILPGELTPTWIKLEFVSIDGALASVRTVIHLSDGNEINEIGPINIESGSNTGFTIPANTSVTDHIYIRGFGNISIADETTSVYTGVERLIVSAHYSNATHGLQIIWDKQTGLMLEQDITVEESTTFMKISDTNIWQTQSITATLYQLVILVVILGAGILVLVFLLRKRKRL